MPQFPVFVSRLRSQRIRCMLSLLSLAVLCSACQTVQPVSSVPPMPDVQRIQTDSYEQVVEAINDLGRTRSDDQMLVIFDLDNTLLAMDGDLGSDQWYSWQSSLEDCDPNRVVPLLDLQGSLYHQGSMHLTDPLLPDILRSIQQQQVTTMVLTARGPDFRLPTFRELRRNHLSFTRTAPGEDFAETRNLGDKGREVLFEDGVMMVAGQHKGHMLTALYRELGRDLPEAIIFVDDKRKNVDQVHDALKDLPVTARLFHYTQQLDRVNALDTEQASRDLMTLLPALRTIEQVMGTGNGELPERLFCQPEA